MVRQNSSAGNCNRLQTLANIGKIIFGNVGNFENLILSSNCSYIFVKVYLIICKINSDKILGINHTNIPTYNQTLRAAICNSLQTLSMHFDVTPYLVSKSSNLPVAVSVSAVLVSSMLEGTSKQNSTSNVKNTK